MIKKNILILTIISLFIFTLVGCNSSDSKKNNVASSTNSTQVNTNVQEPTTVNDDSTKQTTQVIAPSKPIPKEIETKYNSSFNNELEKKVFTAINEKRKSLNYKELTQNDSLNKATKFISNEILQNGKEIYSYYEVLKTDNYKYTMILKINGSYTGSVDDVFNKISQDINNSNGNYTQYLRLIKLKNVGVSVAYSQNNYVLAVLLSD